MNRCIRLATADDRTAAACLYHDAIATAPWIPPAARGQADFAADTEGEVVYVYVDSTSGVVGFISIWVADTFVHHLYVDPLHRGHGVGTALLASLKGWLAAPWTLKCLDANRSAMAFYLARGWKPIGNGDSDHGPYTLLENEFGRSGELAPCR